MDLEKLNQAAVRYQEYLQAKLYLLQRLAEFNSDIEQAMLVDQEENIPDSLDSRAKVMAKVDALDQANSHLLQLFKSQQGSLILEQLGVLGKGLRILEGQISENLSTFAKRDVELLKAMQQRRMELGRKIKQIRDGKKMNNAYEHGQDQYDGYYFDRTK